MVVVQDWKTRSAKKGKSRRPDGKNPGDRVSSGWHDGNSRTGDKPGNPHWKTRKRSKVPEAGLSAWEIPANRSRKDCSQSPGIPPAAAGTGDRKPGVSHGRGLKIPHDRVAARADGQGFPHLAPVRRPTAGFRATPHSLKGIGPSRQPRILSSSLRGAVCPALRVGVFPRRTCSPWKTHRDQSTPTLAGVKVEPE